MLRNGRSDWVLSLRLPFDPSSHTIFEVTVLGWAFFPLTNTKINGRSNLFFSTLFTVKVAKQTQYVAQKRIRCCAFIHKEQQDE